MKVNEKKIFNTNLISSVVASQSLDSAFQEVYKNRKQYHHNNDVRHLTYVNCLENIHGEYKLITQGSSEVCLLSSRFKSLDNQISKQNNVSYICYMDDFILAKSRLDLSEYVKLMHIAIKKLKFKLALDKTYIGKISKGFDFLGYRFNNLGLRGLANKTIINFINKATKLYERDAPDHRVSCYFIN